MSTTRVYHVAAFARPQDRAFLGLLSAAILVVPLVTLTTFPRPDLIGYDFATNLNAASEWLAGRSFYPEAQLAGPFVDDGRVILYPPTALLLFAPLAMLPSELAAVLWLGFPVLALGWQFYRLRPAPIVWPFLAIVLAWPATTLSMVVWNPVLLAVGLFALATMYHWPAALIAVKASVAPFAFWGAWRRSWWIAVGVLVLLSLPFGAMWLDWFTVLRNSQIGGVWHSIQQWPMFLFPVLVWLGRDRLDAKIEADRSAVVVPEQPQRRGSAQRMTVDLRRVEVLGRIAR